MAEFQAEGRGAPDDTTMVGAEIRQYRETWADREAFARYVRVLRDQARQDGPLPEGLVPCTTLWWIDDAGTGYLGRLAIRHRLTPALFLRGGHIGYDVRLTARRRGHATAMLAAALPLARDLGIGQALVTCDVDNVASIRVIEINGGNLEDEREGCLRYWVPTGSGGLPSS